ncbi:hypothetical protein [Candidatus Albibeggiatoa sp. nov. NOAA]|uniref:hypothetical protein n=1 Tax=Candidatus Albibeggiatoa sp. nov. NOAA TaxID=3162724 RepID=UPI0032F0D4AB|nr:hypothetical protein [Thiotrichaceae bacterium]
MLVSRLSLLFVLFLVTSCTLDPYINTGSQSNDIEHFKQSVIANDEGHIISFSTVYAHQKRHGSVVWDDNFFRGFIDKRTGQKSFQIYNVVYYSGNGRGDWRHYKQANYTVPNGQQVANTQTLRQVEDCSALGLYGKCVYSEHVAFDINEQLLNTIAQQNTDAAQWMYSLVPQRGEQYPDGLFAIEAEGLISAMAEYKINTTTSALSVPRHTSNHPATVAVSIDIPKSQLPPSRDVPNGWSVF